MLCSAAPGAYAPTRLASTILNSRAALEGQRKQVTVLFADLKGSMELLADRDPEEAHRKKGTVTFLAVTLYAFELSRIVRGLGPFSEFSGHFKGLFRARGEGRLFGRSVRI